MKVGRGDKQNTKEKQNTNKFCYSLVTKSKVQEL